MYSKLLEEATVYFSIHQRTNTAPDVKTETDLRQFYLFLLSFHYEGIMDIVNWIQKSSSHMKWASFFNCIWALTLSLRTE